jgi:quinol-cytochrome oxidoreductase complex cytochrome b subunit
VSGSGSVPPVPRPPGGTPPPHAGAGRVSRRSWPSWAMVGVSAAGLVVAAAALNAQLSSTRFSLAMTGFLLVLTAGTALLFVQRVLDVSVARRSGTPLVSSFRPADKAAFAMLILASVANGVVVALQVARR